jgi:hypothetical protein
MVKVIEYPRDAATNARAIPVLPLLGVPYHGGSDPALHRVGGVAAFDLAVHLRFRAAHNAIELDERSVSDAE